MISIQDIYDILSKHYERHSSLFLTREINSKDSFFYNFSCPRSTQQLIDAMNAASLTDEVSINSLEAKLYGKNVSAFRCEEYMAKVSEHRTPNSYYISVNFYGITGVVVKKAYKRYEAKLSYNPKHIISIYINARNGDLYGKGVNSRETLYPMSFSSYVNKLLLHSQVFREIFKDILILCSNGCHIIKDIVRTIDEEGYVAMPITVFDIKKSRTKDDMIRTFTETDLPVDFNRRSLNHGYLLAELSKLIPPEQIGYMIQIDKEIVVNTVREIYKKVYPLDDFAGEFVVRYYVKKFGILDSMENRQLIRDYIRLAKDHDLPISINFKSANRLVQEHNHLARLYGEQELSAELSRPLIARDTRFAELRHILPYEFEWITTTGRLFEEGENQHNCVFSYRDKIRNDESTIYHWSKEDRDYTIEFGYRMDGRYTIQQMLQTNNARANPDDREYVKRCLASRSGSPFAETAGNDADMFEMIEDVENAEIPF